MEKGLTSVLLLAVGMLLQLTVGSLNPSFLRYPWGLILALVYVYLLISAYILRNRFKLFDRLSDSRASICSLLLMLFLLLVFGLVRQDGRTEGFAGVLGLSRMSRSWIFALPLMYFTTVISLNAVKDVATFSKHKVWITFSHVGLSVILIAGIFGSGDFVRVNLPAYEGMPARKGVVVAGVADNTTYELPFELTLKKFTMEEYPARLLLVDRLGGKAAPRSITLEGGPQTAISGDWTFSVSEYIGHAERKDDGYVPSDNPYVTVPAAYVVAKNGVTGKSAEGWISRMNSDYDGSSLDLDSRYMLEMSSPEPKRFLSEVMVDLMYRKPYLAEIEVNHPAKAGLWSIYQSGYDLDKNSMKAVSIFDCVRDPWYSATRIALWLLLLSAAGMVCFGGKKR